MRNLESRNTMIVPITAAPGSRPARGKFFLAPAGFAGGATGGAMKGVRAGGPAWPEKRGGPAAVGLEEGDDPYRFAFGLCYLVTLFLYARPDGAIPAMGTL